MSVSGLISEATARGVELVRNGDRIRVRGPEREVTDDLLHMLRQQKGELLEALDDLHEAREERAAILEYDHEIPREQAEAEARARINWVSCATCANWTGESQCAAGLHMGSRHDKHRLRICGFHVPKDAR